MNAAHEAGKRIRAARKERGFSLRALAEAVDLDFSYLGRVERGAAASLPTYERIAKVLRVSLEALFYHNPRSVQRARPVKPQKRSAA